MNLQEDKYFTYTSLRFYIDSLREATAKSTARPQDSLYCIFKNTALLLIISASIGFVKQLF